MCQYQSSLGAADFRPKLIAIEHVLIRPSFYRFQVMFRTRIEYIMESKKRAKMYTSYREQNPSKAGTRLVRAKVGRKYPTETLVPGHFRGLAAPEASLVETYRLCHTAVQSDSEQNQSAAKSHVTLIICFLADLHFVLTDGVLLLPA